MAYQVLTLDDTLRERIAQVKRHAEEVPFTKAFLQEGQTARGVKEADPAAVADHTVAIPVGYSVTYSIEEQGDKWVRHLAVTYIPGPKGTLPAMPAVNLLMEEFGMNGKITPETKPEGTVIKFYRPENQRWADSVHIFQEYE